MILKRLLIVLLICSCIIVRSQNAQKVNIATYANKPPKIDGLLDDAVWKQAKIIKDFSQYLPVYDAPVSQITEVSILYDNSAVYIGAMMYDTSPDSILKQLGNRDDKDMNADAISIGFDTYNTQSDAYVFQVTAAGVQTDCRQYDNSYSAVWQSAVKILSNGWSAEFKIPYSAIRFPSKDSNMVWGLEVSRIIRRNRETDQWALENKSSNNLLVYWGKLAGIKNIKAPVRLSFNPYLSIYGQHYPYNKEGKSNFSNSLSGGLDLKYGINESFTLDMTLLPDFSQVKSDNIIKNLSAFETIYDEQRPFFTEAIDLFQKGSLFYSRRIGSTPMLYYNVGSTLLPGESIKKNPSQTNLLNVTKISGRNNNGLGIGVLNAITDNTYAIVEDSVGNKRKILTDPLTNYNIVVIDQVLKNNSDFFIVNTNVTRDKEFDDANVTSSGLSLVDRSNTWKFSTLAAISQQYHKDSNIDGVFDNTIGHHYNGSLYKIKGNFLAGIWGESFDPYFDANDLGVTLYNNYYNYGITTNYNIYEPFWKLINIYNNLQYTRSVNFSTGNPTDSKIKFRHTGTTANYFTYWLGASTWIEKLYDYWEPRVYGRYYVIPTHSNSLMGFSTDYRKTFAADFQMEIDWLPEYANTNYSIYVRPIVRVNDKFTFSHSISFCKEFNNIGFASIDTSNNIIFANRDLKTIENYFNGKYLFKNDLSLSLSLRHYWRIGKYDHYYFLNDDGRLNDNANYNGNNDFNFNSFNIYLSFDWRFAPGSNLSVVWKNVILKDDQVILNNFFDDLNSTFKTPQTNSLSLKIIYYLDYQNLKKRNNK